MYYVYILQSEKDGLWYTGYTEHLAQRIKQHNEGSTESTKRRRPLKLIYYEAYLDKEDALGREKFLKSGSGKRFLKKQLHHYFSRIIM
jgi:putative endonuclease